MKKIIDKIKKCDIIIIIFIVGLVSFTYISSEYLDANDPLWNFSNIYKMSNGCQIYNDLNVIITPLYFYIGYIIFSIFSKNYLTYYIYQVIISVVLFCICYILMKKLNIKKINAMLYTIIISIITISIIPEGSYNMLAIVFVVAGTYNIILNINLNKHINISNIIQGILCFLVFASKQSIGLLFVLGMALAQFVTTKNKKQAIINIIVQGITMFILIALLLIYMHSKNYLNSFINFAFCGIGEFANKNFRFEIDTLIYSIVFVAFNIICYIITYLKIDLKENEKNIIRVLAIISLFMNFIVYPLINKSHLIIGSIVFMILVIYIVNILVFRELVSGKKVEKIKKIVLIITIITIILVCSVNIYKYVVEINSDKYYFNKENPYYGAIAEEKTIQEINEICKYIKEQNKKGYDVKVVSCYADLYMNILNKNNKIIDLPFHGNLGKEGIEGLKKEIINLKNTKVLIVNNEKYVHNQESKELLDFVKENFEFNGEICKFLIYSRNI